MPNSGLNRPRGFTLVELLAVIALLGVFTALVVPSIGAGLSGSRISSASRIVAGQIRYSRTVALVNQREAQLVLTSAGDAKSFATAEVALKEEFFPAAGDAPEEETSSGEARRKASLDIAAEYNAKSRMQGIGFEFEGFLDTLDGEDAPKADEDGKIRLSFSGNGLCRPFSLKIGDGASFARIKVDRTCSVKIEGPFSE